jgi:beta-galactosidase beta subunit
MGVAEVESQSPVANIAARVGFHPLEKFAETHVLYIDVELGFSWIVNYL